jgi:hypothetical protein
MLSQLVLVDYFVVITFSDASSHQTTGVSRTGKADIADCRQGTNLFKLVQSEAEDRYRPHSKPDL